MPGFSYQIGILFAAPTNTIEFALQEKLGYPWALTAFELTVIVLLGVTVALGSERRGKAFTRVPLAEAASDD
jgi:hypothetical protein